MTSSKPTVNRSKWGDILTLTHTNYDEWRDDMIPVLSAMRAYATVVGDDPEQQLLNLDHDHNYDDWKP
jgi:predicted hydrolase (HD superfamily)